MTIQKELSEIAEKWTEPEYRQRPELSYSTLSTYEKTGFDGLDHIFDKKESPSLLLGSMVDAMITGGEDEFNKLFTVLDINVTEGGRDTVNQLVSMNLPWDNFNDIPEKIVSEAAKTVGFWQAGKWDNTRYKQVLKTGNVAEYYAALRYSDKILVDTTMFQNAVNMVRALRESPSTAGYFADNDPMSPIRRYYQLKFKAKLDGIGYRCMADEIVVDYEKKKIYPVDLKTSSHTEWNFEESFCQWNYMIQARLYHAIIKANMEKDPYFKDFTLEDYRFIVVNKNTLTPLVWEFPLTKSVGTLVDDKGNEYRHPFEIGKELRQYLDLRPQVPEGISQNGINTINCLRKK